MTQIKFGTDGWSAIIAKEFTTDNVARVSLSVAEFLNEKNVNSLVVIGHDCRFAGEIFAETVAKVLPHKRPISMACHSMASRHIDYPGSRIRFRSNHRDSA